MKDRVVTLHLPLLDGYALKTVSMPIVPPGSLVQCNTEIDEMLEVSNWLVKPDKSFSGNSSLICHLVKKMWHIEGTIYGLGTRTFRQSLESEGWTVCNR